MKCGLFRSKGGLTVGGAVVGALLVLIVFVILVTYFSPTLLKMFGTLGIFSGTSNNIFNIENECELACLDREKDVFCYNLTSTSLRLGDGRKIRGSCEAMSVVGSVGIFDGIRGCSAFSCEGAVVKPAKCSKGLKSYDCKTWLTTADLKKQEVEKEKLAVENAATVLALKKEAELVKIVGFISEENKWEGIDMDYEESTDYNNFILESKIPVVSIASAVFDRAFKVMKSEYLDELAKSDTFYILYVDVPSFKDTITKDVSTMPAFTFIDSENKNVGSHVGYMSYNEFAAAIKEKFGIVVDCGKCVNGPDVREEQELAKKEKELAKIVRFASASQGWWDGNSEVKTEGDSVDYTQSADFFKFFDYVKETDLATINKPIVVVFGISSSLNNRKMETDYLRDLATSDTFYILYVDGESFDGVLNTRFGVSSYPSFLFWQDGFVVGRSVGALSRDEFVLLLKDELGVEL